MVDLKKPLPFFFVALILIALLAFSGTGCRQPQKPAGPPEKLTLAHVNNYGCVLVHIALKKGLFAQEGLEVTPQPHSFGKQAHQAVIEGKADLATVADTPIMFNIMNGKKIMVLATIQTSNRNEAVVARQDRGTNKPSDLKGKKIGVTLGTTSDFFADVFLQDHGMDRKQVHIIDLKPDEMVGALRGGKVDAAIHERVNGSGYPLQIKGEEILIEAKVLAVADVVEAIASYRPYRPALGIDKALEEIEKNSGVLYDPAVVDICLKLFRENHYELK